MRPLAEDAALIARLQRRDPHAMADLYDRHGKLVYGVVRRMVRDQALAEDIVQETFLRAWVRANQLDPACASLGPWLVTVARNVALDCLRGEERRRTREHQAAIPFIDTALCLNPEQGAELTQAAERLRTAFGHLQPQQRQVLELAYFEGLSQTEMAARLEQPLGTVKTWVRSALENLRRALGVIA